MPFVCPKCSVAALKISSSIELSPDSRSDEITVQITRCTRCGFAGLAVYEESRRGALQAESASHRGYFVDNVKLTSLRKLIVLCPEPRNPRCHCKAHRALGEVNVFGRWIGLDNIRGTSTFNLKLK